MGPIGMSSGMDINSMVSKIVDAERIPKQQRIDFERAKIDTSISAYGRLRESLDTMKNLMANFRQEKAFALRSVNTTEESVVTATATTDAIAGKYAVDVLQLAQSHKIASDVIPEDTRFGPGKLQISLGDEQFDFSLRKNSKLTDVVRAINGASDNPGVRASIIKDRNGPRLIVASNQSGAEKAISINVDAEVGNDLYRFEYKTIEQRVRDLEKAQAEALSVLGMPTGEDAVDSELSPEEAAKVGESEKRMKN
ncbi:flagellar hook-associated protein FliD [Vibrio variabilis]|uniref:Filament cap protein n=1 Tax=Vibrio variabilis TaxID=990271 RepID=A0ABQ0JPW4_9VIBR|nr:flagellar hook-associated protein FliD [Vibrio variabilis]